MDENIKKLAFQQYVHYFRIWFILVAVCLVVTGIAAAAKITAQNRTRGNQQASDERVYDYAGVLTDGEEQELREYIAKCEKRAHVDLVIVTISEPMGISDAEWENNMMNYADDFYDNHMYGWNKAYGDGALILDNWYEDENGSQKGSWLSTAGKMEDTIGWSEENAVLDDMYAYIDSSPYRAYYAAISRLANYGEHGYQYVGGGLSGTLLCFAAVLPIIVALIYAVMNLKQTPAKDTTVSTTYVVNSRAVVNNKVDQFLRKNVTSHRIESSSGGGGGGRSGGHSGGGSYGHHTSSGGHSHGGGGRRR